MVSNGAQLNLKLEDKISGQLFANCPVEAYPGVAIEPVSDSSRYFVLRIQDDNGRSAFIGIGFGVRFIQLFTHFEIFLRFLQLTQFLIQIVYKPLAD